MRDRCWLWRWMMTLARPTVSGPAPARPISEAALLIADSGLRSSWPSIARNSSLAWFERSAACRSSISRVRRLLVAVSSVVRWLSLWVWRLSSSFFIASATNTDTLACRICGITGVNRKSAAPRW